MKDRLAVGRIEKAAGLSTLEARDEVAGLDSKPDLDWVSHTQPLPAPHYPTAHFSSALAQLNRLTK